MKPRNIYGSPVLTLTEVVERLMIAQQNDRQSHFFSYLDHARRAWKELLRDTVWSVRQKWVDVDVTNNTISMPTDVERLIGFSVVDTRGNLQPINVNPNMNTLELKRSSKKCSCQVCGGEDSLCAAIDSIQMRTETVLINGTNYPKRIWNRMDDKGNLQQVEEAPTWNATTEDVEYITTHTAVCALEVTEKGCIRPTLANRELLFNCCGCYMTDCNLLDFTKRPRQDVEPYTSHYGHWKWDAESNDIVHLRNVTADKVIIIYQSDGECDGGEMLVPDYAHDALDDNIMYRQVRYNPTSTWSDKEGARSQAARSRNKLMKYLNPINVSEFMRLSDSIPLW